MFRFEMTARRMDHYGERVEREYPLSLLVDNLDAAIAKGQEVFGATYDTFRKKWSHTFVLKSVSEPDPLRCESVDSGGVS